MTYWPAVKKEYVIGVFGALLAAYIGTSLVRGCVSAETKKVVPIKVDFHDKNGILLLTQISSYTLIDTNGDGEFALEDSVEVRRETFDRAGKRIASSKPEHMRLDQLTDRELELLEFKKDKK